MRVLLLVMVCLAAGCGSKEDAEPGIWFSFDDQSIDEWFDLRPLFLKNDVKVTFFITIPDSLTEEEVSMLRQLASDGHEIGFHGTRHVLSEYYIKEHGYWEYWQKEIVEGMDHMDSLGFSCTAFAYPFGAKFRLSDFLLSQRFDFIRGVSPVNEERDLTIIDEIYYSFDNRRTLSAIGFDNNGGLTQEMIASAIQRTIVRKEVLMLYAHVPTTTADQGYYFDVSLLKYIIEEAKSHNLRFYTTKDF